MSAPLNSILSLARSGLISHQLALQVTSHNLANATTEGFSRQRADIEPAVPIRMPEGLLGTGIRVADVTRARDALLDSAFRREQALSQGSLARHSGLSQVEALLAEPGPLSLGASLDAFWSSWSDLATEPTSSSARVAVVASAGRVVDHFHRLATGLDAVRAESIERLDASIQSANDLVSGIAALNGQIVAARAGGKSAPDLEDRRDLLIDQLSALLPVEVTQRSGGSVGVVASGISLVEGTVHQTLTHQLNGTTWEVSTGGGLVVATPSGVVGGLLGLLGGDIPALDAQLDELAQGLVERVNALHTTGTNASGSTGLRFFDDFGALATVTAGTLAIDSAILADAGAIAAGTPDGGGGYRAGANDVALALAMLRTDTSGGLLAGRSIDGAYRDLASGLAGRVSSADDATEVHTALLGTARERRESVSGVATDEELVRVVQIQAAYGAAARLVGVVEQMYDTLLAI